MCTHKIFSMVVSYFFFLCVLTHSFPADQQLARKEGALLSGWEKTLVIGATYLVILLIYATAAFKRYLLAISAISIFLFS